jgi:hypothetical protein
MAIIYLLKTEAGSMSDTRRPWQCLAVSRNDLVQTLMVIVASSKSMAIGLATTSFHEKHGTYPGSCEAYEIDGEAMLHGFPGSMAFPDPEACVIGGVLGQGRVGFTANEDTIVVFAAFRSPELGEAMQHLRNEGMAHSTCAKLIKQVIGDMPAGDVPAAWTAKPEANEIADRLV